jgi:C-22 sterol desaturase
MDALNATRASSVFTSVLANSKYVSANIPPQLDYVIETITAAGPLTWLFTIIALCVAYDQSMLCCCAALSQPTVARQEVNPD